MYIRTPSVFSNRVEIYAAIWASLWESLVLPYANNKGADQIGAFVIRC